MLPSEDLNRVAREVCNKICEVEKESNNLLGSVDQRLETKNQVTSQLKLLIDEDGVLPTIPHQYGCTTEIPYPKVPPSVTAAGAAARAATNGNEEAKQAAQVRAEVEEMRKYFKAFKEQKTSEVDYREYFRANLCYLEGQWEQNVVDIEEPFRSDRHEIDAKTWVELNQRIRFLHASGRKHNLENLPFLPSAVRNALNGTDPELASWNYRFVCHPLDEDVPTSRFQLIPDQMELWFGQAGKQSPENLTNTPQARFELHPALREDYVSGVDGKKATPFVRERHEYEYIDQLMELAPGRDGYDAVLRDAVLGKDGDEEVARELKNVSNMLNAAKYSRYFQVEGADAMGRQRLRRGFNDPTLWAAKTTNKRVSDIMYQNTDSGSAEKTYEAKWSYALPFEIVYTTPLPNWNPSWHKDRASQQFVGAKCAAKPR